MNSFKKNKTGTDKILSIYWFVILFIVAAGIVYMVVVFYGKPYDVRAYESDILITKVADCLIDSGKLINDYETLENVFFERCSLNFKTEDNFDWNVAGQYFVNFSFYEFNIIAQDGLGSFQKNFSFKIKNLLDFCSVELNNNPYCRERSMYAIDENNNQYVIKILSAVRKTEKNV